MNVMPPAPVPAPDHQEYIGLMAMAEMMYEQTLEWESEDMYQHEPAILQTLNEMTEIHPTYIQAMACFYENAGFPYDVVEACYDRAIAADKNEHMGTMINAVDFYKKTGQTPKMIRHLLQIIAANLTSLSLASLLLSLHYAKLRDEDTTMMYYDMAVTYADLNHTDVFMESAELVHWLDMVSDRGWPQDNPVFAAVQAVAKTRPDITIYRTKYALFTKLNHRDECGICYDVDLHLDLACGHCVCKNCYLKLMTAACCPFCRMRSTQ